jgi:hypothetical protein
MGALRAAELFSLGMVGIGRVYRYFSRGVLVDDDEVCVTHAVRELDYLCLSEPMVNIRRTIRRLRLLGIIDHACERAVCWHMKSQHFPQRTKEALLVAFAYSKKLSPEQLLSAYEENYIDVKAMDAMEVVQCMIHADRSESPRNVKLSIVDWRNWEKEFSRNLINRSALLELRKK